MVVFSLVYFGLAMLIVNITMHVILGGFFCKDPKFDLIF